MAEANQATGALAGGETTNLAERLYGKEPAEAPVTVESPAEPLSVAEKLYGKDPPEEPATEGEQADAEKKDGPDKGTQEAEPYNIRYPEGTFVVDEPLMKEFTTWARENKLTEEQVQAAADFHLKSLGNVLRETAEFREIGVKRYDEVEGWRAEFNKDPYFGGAKAKESVAAANRALNLFGSPEEVGRLKKEMNRTGLGNHPVLIRGLARVARLLGDKAPPTGSKPADMAKRLYPDLD